MRFHAAVFVICLSTFAYSGHDTFESAKTRYQSSGPVFCELPTNIQRAISLMENVDKGNANDVKVLWDYVQAARNKLTTGEFEEVVIQAKARLIADIAIFQNIKGALDKEKDAAKRGSAALRTSLGKLIGSPSAGLTGILEDAGALLSEPISKNPAYQTLSEIPTEANAGTVAKAALLYVAVTLSGGADLTSLKACVPKLQLLYPAELPAGASAGDVALYCDGKIMFPNVGFIFGGDLKAGVCRGLDCSAFISHCEAHSHRISTMILEYQARELSAGLSAFTGDELKVRDEFLRDYGYSRLISDYESVTPGSADDLKPGDIVTWRTKTGGHTVLVLEPQNKDFFLGIEANREDDKSKEGIGIDSFTLERPNGRTFVVRKKR